VIQDPNYARHVEIGWNYRMAEVCAAVALGQLERLDLLVSLRKKAASYFAQAVEGCAWLTPQRVPEGYEHAYWTYVLRLDRDDITWHDFRAKYLEFGGEPFYGAWRLTYLGPRPWPVPLIILGGKEVLSTLRFGDWDGRCTQHRHRSRKMPFRQKSVPGCSVCDSRP